MDLVSIATFLLIFGILYTFYVAINIKLLTSPVEMMNVQELRYELLYLGGGVFVQALSLGLFIWVSIDPTFPPELNIINLKRFARILIFAGGFSWFIVSLLVSVNRKRFKGKYDSSLQE